MAEEQAKHRQKQEDHVLKADAERSDRGLILGFILCVAFLITSVFLIAHGYVIPGTVIGTVDIAGLAGTFIYGTKSRHEERKMRIRELSGLGRD